MQAKVNNPPKYSLSKEKFITARCSQTCHWIGAQTTEKQQVPAAFEKLTTKFHCSKSISLDQIPT